MGDLQILLGGSWEEESRGIMQIDDKIVKKRESER